MKDTSSSEFKKIQDKTAEAYAKFVVLVWVVYGIYAIFAHKLEGNFVSLFIFISLYFSIGIALVGFSSIIINTPIRLLNELCNKNRNIILTILTIIVNQVLAWLLFALWAIFLANWVIEINNSLF